MATFYDFPEEVVMQILSWLPVIYLLRCKSVCKMWQFIISDPEFTQAHLINSHIRPSVLIDAGVFDKIDKFRRSASLISNSIQDSVDLHRPPCLSQTAVDHNCTSCDGLVCLIDFYGYDIFLWNPSTRQYCKILPSDKNLGRWPHPYLGFYFDPISNDYRILSIVYCETGVLVELYSTSSSCWREIQVDKALSSFLSCRSSPLITCGPAIKGVLYMNGSDEIISFQLRDEMFKLISLPNYDRRRISTQSKSKIFDFEGCVGIILHCDKDKSLSLWTLDDDVDDGDGGGTVSWTKKFNLEASFKIDWTVIYLGEGQFVTSENSERVILYDHNKKEIRKFQDQNWSYINAAHKYTESLVSVEGFIKY